MVVWLIRRLVVRESYLFFSAHRHAERLKTMLEASKGTIALGGKVDVDEKFMEPTILTGIDWTDATMKVRVLFSTFLVFRLLLITRHAACSHVRKININERKILYAVKCGPGLT
jgi:hypothetical protein